MLDPKGAMLSGRATCMACRGSSGSNRLASTFKIRCNSPNSRSSSPALCDRGDRLGSFKLQPLASGEASPRLSALPVPILAEGAHQAA